MPLPIHVIDAFARRPFTGNPAAVVVLPPDHVADPEWMQAVAAEMKHSETAFVQSMDADRPVFSLRWFTPGAEVRLCGHATLATSHTLWTTGHVAIDEPLHFETLSGRLTCVRTPAGAVRMDFPATRPEASKPAVGLLAAMGLESVVSCWRSRFDYLLELPDEAAVVAVRPDFRALRDLATRGIMVTARGTEVDFVSRFFAPGVGVDEDPVTGSAHCALTPFWAERLGKPAMRARQLSARGGDVAVELHGDRVVLEGHAVTVTSGQLLA